MFSEPITLSLFSLNYLVPLKYQVTPLYILCSPQHSQSSKFNDGLLNNSSPVYTTLSVGYGKSNSQA